MDAILKFVIGIIVLLCLVGLAFLNPFIVAGIVILGLLAYIFMK